MPRSVAQLSQAVVFASDAAGTTPAYTSVAAAAVSTLLVAAALSPPALQVFVFNESTSIMYIALGPTASLTAYLAQVAPNSYFVVPAPYGLGVSAIWATAVGSARVTVVS